MEYSIILYSLLLFQACFVVSIFNKVTITPKKVFSLSTKSPNSLTESSLRYNIYPTYVKTYDSKIKNKVGFFISSTSDFLEYLKTDNINSPSEGIFFSMIDLNLLEYRTSIMLSWKKILSLKYDLTLIDDIRFYNSKIIDINDNDLLIYISCILI